MTAREEELPVYICERNEMLRRLDPIEFMHHYEKWRLPMPRGGFVDNVEVPLIMMHKCRLQITTFSEAEKAVSREWLRARGYAFDMASSDD